ncbi:MAG: amino acid permease [Gemmatimonadetes bacterium]|nr:amino acid permease [Gemmatimonadota bacterium]
MQSFHTPSAAPPPSPAPGAQPGFDRALGTFDAAMVVIGGIIGAGIFINPYIVAQRLDSGAWVIAAWVAGGAIALAGAFAFAELGALIPRAGGPYVYLTRAYHPMAGFLYGWALLFMIQGGAVAAIGITFAEYALRFTGTSAASTPLAIAAILVVSAINYVGVRPGSLALNVFVVLKVAAIAALIGFGALLPEAPPGAATAVPATTLPLLAFGAALVPIMFSYGGWQSANWVAEEIREPERRLPRAIIAGTLVVILVYVAVNIVYLRALGHAGLAATLTPAADAAGRIAGDTGVRLISLAIAVSTFGFLHLTVLAPTRVYWAMGADGVFFPSMAKLHPRFRTPSLAIAAQSGWAILLVLTGTYAQLVDYVVFADWVFFGLSVAALFVLRQRVPLSERPAHLFRTPGYPWLPALFIASAVLVFVSVVWSNPVRSGVGAGLLVTGVPAFLWWRHRKKSV